MIGNIQTLRFIAAAWVALYHLRDIGAPFGNFMVLPRGMTQLGFAGVDIFFVISGAIMAETTRHLASGSASALQFITKRFSRIYTGWWPFFLLYLIAFLLSGNLREEHGLVASFFLWPQNLNRLLLPITWTLTFELYFYITVAALLLWSRNKAGHVLLAIAGAIGVLNLLFLMQGFYTPARFHEVTFFQSFFASPLILEFIAGFMVSEAIHARKPQSLTPWCVTLIVLCVASYCYQTYMPLHDSGMAGFFHAPERALLVGGACAALVGLAIILERRGFSPFPPLQKLGDAGYSIYLAHLLVITVAFFIWRKANLGFIPNFVFALLVFVGILLYSVLHYRFVERPFYQAFRRYFGQLRPSP